MTDIGPGDCVEAVRDVVSYDGTVYARRGERDIVEVVHGPLPTDEVCFWGHRLGGFELVEHTLPPGTFFCVCGWRKVGPSRDETTRLFAEDLHVRAPETEKV
jgi:hypothetical protein